MRALLARLWPDDRGVSLAWLRDRASVETRQGWTDGPVWRTPGMLKREAEREQPKDRP